MRLFFINHSSDGILSGIAFEISKGITNKRENGSFICERKFDSCARVCEICD
jgi:hypothetical protein